MLYVARDSNGKVCELHQAPQDHAVEALPADNPEVLQFIHERWRQNELTELDRDFVRAIEDIIELLIAKGIILFTDLPPRVQEKLQRRKEVRGQIHYAGYFDDNPDGDIIPI
ncbi:hypothetical protein [Azonexus sp.]|jgi:hypothetical protein|uniref:hypothetical protein n=1 Tax=Azonexus sp. TaxID=1872668 RepID=UPI00281D9043|nr:hypothetical protein [Azonexus sp.]MDR1995817.1 hypothetical protein [Azonexus sp.]